MIKKNKDSLVKARERWEKTAYPIVKRIVDKHDPESLLKIGAPADEYDSISHDITGALCQEQHSAAHNNYIANIIAFSFHYAFGEWGKEVVYHKFYHKMAKELKQALLEKKLLQSK
jgi:hypothetical protein